MFSFFSIMWYNVAVSCEHVFFLFLLFFVFQFFPSHFFLHEWYSWFVMLSVCFLYFCWIVTFFYFNLNSSNCNSLKIMSYMWFNYIILLVLLLVASCLIKIQIKKNFAFHFITFSIISNFDKANETTVEHFLFKCPQLSNLIEVLLPPCPNIDNTLYSYSHQEYCTIRLYAGQWQRMNIQDQAGSDK